MMINLDQARDRTYTLEALDHLQKKLKNKKADNKNLKPRFDFASVTLLEVVLTTFNAKAEILNKLNIVSSTALAKVVSKFTDSLLEDLKGLLQKPKKFKKADDYDQKKLSVLSRIDALTSLNIDKSKSAELTDDLNTLLASLSESQTEFATRLQTFIFAHAEEARKALPDSFNGDVSTIYGRHSINQNVNTRIVGKSHSEKLAILKSICEAASLPLVKLDQLLAARQLIISCEGGFHHNSYMQNYC